MRINQFYTLFLFIFFSFGIMLYEALPIQFIDEVMVLILVLYAILHIAFTKKEISRELKCFGLIAIFYLAYSLYIGVTVPKAVFIDFQQQIKPYASFYCTYYLAPAFSLKQKQFLYGYVCLLSLICAIIIVTGQTELFFKGFTAVLATTILTISLYHYYFSSNTHNAKKKSLLIMSLGLLSGKSKFFSEYIMGGYFFLFNKRRLNFSSFKVILSLFLIIAIIATVIWEKLNFYYIGGMENSEGIARPLLYKSAFSILGDYFPLGSGLGTFCNDAARKFYSPLFYKYDLDKVWGLSPDMPLFATDCFYPTLAQFGILGIYLFFRFWRKRYFQIKENIHHKNYIIGMMTMVILLFDSVADSTYLGNRGVLFFILLALVCKKENQVKFTTDTSSK